MSSYQTETERTHSGRVCMRFILAAWFFKGSSSMSSVPYLFRHRLQQIEAEPF